MTMSRAALMSGVVAMALAAAPLAAQPSGTAVTSGAVLLLAGHDDSDTLASLKAALISPHPAVRIAAARVIGTGPYPTLAADLIAALAREQVEVAAVEMLRDVLWIGGDAVLQIADEQARRIGPSGSLTVAAWLAREAPERFLERVPTLAASSPDERLELRGILEMAAAQHPTMSDAFESAWKTMAAQDPQPTTAGERTAFAKPWRPADPVTAALAKPIEPTLMSSLLQASSCKPAPNRVGLASIAFRPDGRAARVELASEQLPKGCVDALTAIARTTVADDIQPVVTDQREYVITPFTETFAACTASVAAHPPTESIRPASPPGKIVPPRKKKDVRPLYPPAAQQAGVQGTVIMEATVASTGCISAAHVVKSIRGLDAAALWAVSQWEYTPTLLNGTPVPVIMMVSSTFTLR